MQTFAAAGYNTAGPQVGFFGDLCHRGSEADRGKCGEQHDARCGWRHQGVRVSRVLLGAGSIV